MIDIPYPVAIKKLNEATGLSIAELESRIQAKVKQLSGLLSQDGAVQIIANELGVQLSAPAQAGGDYKIKELQIGARGISVAGQVLKKYDVKEFNKNGKQGRVGSMLIGDETGSCRLVFWNDQVDVFIQLQEGDIVVVRNPFVKESFQKDRLELQLNTQSTLLVNPEGVTVERKEYIPQQERAPAVQKYIKDLDGSEDNVEIIATVLQVYDPRFFDCCPQCNKKVLGENQCPTHGEVVPGLNWSMSAILDDGTGNIRASFWKQQSLKLSGKSEKEFSQYKNDPLTFEDIKNDLLGEFVKVVGKVKRNETFDRLEFTAQLVYTDVDPAAELQNLDKKMEQQRNSKPTPAADADVEKPIVKPASKSNDGEEINVIQDDVVSLDDL